MNLSRSIVISARVIKNSNIFGRRSFVLTEKLRRFSYSPINDVFCLQRKYNSHIALNGDKFIGDLNGNGQAHGNGTMYFESGIISTGEWENGKANGFVTCKFPDGASYEGTCVENKRHGTGVFKSECGDVYEGQFKNDHIHGHGVMVFADGSIYNGEWANNKRHGVGKCTFSTTPMSSVEGDWEDDQLHGTVVYTLPNGDVFTGEMANNKMCGHGVLVSKQMKLTYTGLFKDNEFNGKGELKHHEGEVVVGTFTEGKLQGKAKATFPNGDIFDGVYEKGMRISGEVFYADGTHFKGEFGQDGAPVKGILRQNGKELHIGETDEMKGQEGKGGQGTGVKKLAPGAGGKIYSTKTKVAKVRKY